MTLLFASVLALGAAHAQVIVTSTYTGGKSDCCLDSEVRIVEDNLFQKETPKVVVVGERDDKKQIVTPLKENKMVYTQVNPNFDCPDCTTADIEIIEGTRFKEFKVNLEDFYDKMLGWCFD